MAIRLFKITTELTMKTFIDYLHELRDAHDPQDARYWSYYELIQELQKEPEKNVHITDAKGYATSLVQKFMCYDNDLNERQRYEYAIFSAEIHVLTHFHPGLPMDVIKYYHNVLDELKNKKNGR